MAQNPGRNRAATKRHDQRRTETGAPAPEERELRTAGRRGFEVVGLTVGETEFGGSELVVITRRVDAR